MTKAENRAAAKAYQRHTERRWREGAHAAAVAADLEQLASLRKYLIFDRKAGVPAQDLISAIDDYQRRKRLPSSGGSRDRTILRRKSL